MLSLCDIDEMFPQTHDGSVFSDLYKEAHGSRPRGSACQFRDIAHFEEEWARVHKIQQQVLAEDEVRTLYDIERFEQRVTDAINTGAEGRKDAIRWILQAHDLEDSQYSIYEELEYNQGLPYGYIQKSLES